MGTKELKLLSIVCVLIGYIFSSSLFAVKIFAKETNKEKISGIVLKTSVFDVNISSPKQLVYFLIFHGKLNFFIFSFRRF